MQNYRKQLEYLRHPRTIQQMPLEGIVVRQLVVD